MERSHEGPPIAEQAWDILETATSRSDVADFFEKIIESYRVGELEHQLMLDYLYGAAAVTKVRTSLGAHLLKAKDPGDGQPSWRFVGHVLNAAFGHS